MPESNRGSRGRPGHTGAARLNLVSFWTTPCDDLRDALAGLGYRVNYAVGGSWRGAGSFCSGLPVVVLLSDSLSARDEVRSVLSQAVGVPTVGVFQRHVEPSDPTLLDQCREIVSWPCHETELKLRLARAGVTRMAAPPSSGPQSTNLVGRSAAFRRSMDCVAKLAACDATVLIEGETGTGKELAARAIHYLGRRRSHAFIPVNCGALPEALVENELFGHGRGAYTDAKEDRPGVVADAEGGTLFLDEIEALSVRGQVALLRFLQDQIYRPLGGGRPVQANVRIIAACNEDLGDAVERRAFRSDLFFRLKILSLRMPPLREHPDDVVPLAEHFARQFAYQYRSAEKTLSPAALATLTGYSWPGNVRELENLIHREFLLAEGGEIQIAPSALGSVPGADSSRPDSGGTFRHAKAAVIADFEAGFLRRLLDENEGNVSLAARMCGKERRTLGKLLRKHGIHPRDFGGGPPAARGRANP